jgi:two-component system nitrate/nitrite response regulator NarL
MPSIRGDAAAIDVRLRPAAIGVVIADDHPLVLDGLELLLRRETDVHVLARAATAADAVQAVLTKHPDILLVDLELGGDSGLQVIRDLRGRTSTRFVIMANAVSDEQAIEALRLGVRGVLLKNLPSELILKCLRKVHSGGRWMENTSSGRALDRLLIMSEGGNGNGNRHSTGLSPRELEIARLVGTGLRNRAIAERLTITEATVKIHVHNIFVKMNVRSRVDLALRVREESFA